MCTAKLDRKGDPEKSLKFPDYPRLPCTIDCYAIAAAAAIVRLTILVRQKSKATSRGSNGGRDKD